MAQKTRNLFKPLLMGSKRHPTLSLLLGLTLSGCMGVYEGGFECPPGHGVGCKSISEVNHMVNQEELPPSSLSNLSHTPCRACRCDQEDSGNLDSSSPSENSQIWYAPWVGGPLGRVSEERVPTGRVPVRYVS